MKESPSDWRKLVFVLLFVAGAIAAFYAAVSLYGGFRWLYIEQAKDFDNQVSRYLLPRGAAAMLVTLALWAAAFLALGRRSTNT